MILFTDTARVISTIGIARRELDRIERVTGCRPDEWMHSVHDRAIADNMNGSALDFDAFTMQVACFTDHFIDVVRETCPATISY